MKFNTRIASSTAALVAALFLSACSKPEPVAATNWTDKLDAHMKTSDGGSLVAAAIDAHGGMDNWLDNGVLQFRWVYNMRDRGPKAQVDTLQTIDPDSLQAIHQVANSDITFGYDGTSYWVAPADSAFAPPPRFWTHTPLYFVGIPFVFADLNANYQLLEDKLAFEGKDYQQVKVTYDAGAGDAPDDYYILLIDPDSKTVKGARYIVTSDLVYKGGPLVEKFITLDALKEFKGVMLPTAHRTFSMEDGRIGSEMRDSQVSEIQWLERGRTDFAKPAGAKTL